MSTHEHAIPKPAVVASSVKNVTSGLLQRKCACGGSSGLAGKCAACKEKPFLLQRKAKSGHAESFSVPPIVHEVLRSPGQALDPATRGFMESRFGHDFSQVRVHSNAKAAKSARAVVADAFTGGRNIVFGEGKYNPRTDEGRKLLAHELTHVLQQGQFLSSLSTTGAGGAAEQEANRMAAHAMSGHPIAVSSRGASRIQRQVRGPQEIQRRLDEIHRELYGDKTKTLSEEKERDLLDEYAALERELDDLPTARVGREIAQKEQRLADVEHKLSTTSTTPDRETQLWNERHALHAERGALKQERAEERSKETRRDRTARKFREIPDNKLKAVYFRHLEYYLSDRASWEQQYDLQTLNGIVQERFPNAPWYDEAQLMLLKRTKGDEREMRAAERRIKPVTPPRNAADTIPMIEEARWWVEEEGSPSGRVKALEITSSVEAWLRPITRSVNMDRHFRGLPFFDNAKVFPGKAHAEVLDLVRRLHGGSSVGGWWAITLNVLKAAQPYLDVLSGQKKLQETSIPGLHAEMKRGAKVTVVTVPAAAVGTGLVVWGAMALPAVPMALTRVGLQVAPRASVWVGLHPGVSTAIATSGLVLAEEYQTTGNISPLSVFFALMHTKYSYLGDVSSQRVTPIGAPSPTAHQFKPKGVNLLGEILFKTQIAVAEAVPATGGIPAGGPTGTSRAVPTLVRSASGPHVFDPDTAPSSRLGSPLNVSNVPTPTRVAAAPQPANNPNPTPSSKTYFGGGGGEGGRKGMRTTPMAKVEKAPPARSRTAKASAGLSELERDMVRSAELAVFRLGKPLQVKTKSAAVVGDVHKSGYGARGGGAERTQLVLDMGKEIGHDFAKNASLDGGVPGQEKAGHAEKLAAIDNPGKPLAVDRAMCLDCFAFFQKLALAKGTNLVVREPTTTWIFRPDGVRIGLPVHSGGKVVIYPDGSASAEP